MKINYTNTLHLILNDIYSDLIYKYFKNENINVINENNLNDLLKQTLVIGNDSENIIINFMNEDDMDLLRCEVSKYHNTLYPTLINYKGEKVSDPTYNKFAMFLWQNHMNEFLISDIYDLSNSYTIYDYIKNNNTNIVNEINDKLNKTILVYDINVNSDDNLCDVITNMILENKMEFDYIYSFVDLNSIRNEMISMCVDFNAYTEIEKVEDNPKYCLNNHFKYDNDELLTFLINSPNFNVIKKA